MNVLVVQGSSGMNLHQIFDSSGDKALWFNPVVLPPLASDACFPLPWVVIDADSLAATYADAFQVEYTAQCRLDRSIVLKGNRLPKWDQDASVPHWAVADMNPHRRWAEKEEPAPGQFRRSTRNECGHNPLLNTLNGGSIPSLSVDRHPKRRKAGVRLGYTPLEHARPC